jgi:rhodanese-related sulfurtransferase
MSICTRTDRAPARNRDNECPFRTDATTVKQAKPREAHEILQNNPNALLIDCRTEFEFYYVGHPIGAINVEWQTAPDFDRNPRFVEGVMKEAAGDRNRPVLLICRSGRRTLEAATALEAAGFTDVTNVLEGFEGELDRTHHRSTVNGWRVAGLPWQQL